MSLFCKDKCQCKRRCKGWFGAQPDIERACRNACKTKSDLTKDEFLCSGNWIGEEVYLAAYGHDPCPGTGTSLDDFLDPLGDRAREDQQVEKYQGVLIGGALLIILAMGIFIFVILK